MNESDALQQIARDAGITVDELLTKDKAWLLEQAERAEQQHARYLADSERRLALMGCYQELLRRYPGGTLGHALAMAGLDPAEYLIDPYDATDQDLQRVRAAVDEALRVANN